jgi:two-component system OmpR family response regulator
MDQILVVDDDPNIRELLRDYLQGMGYGVATSAGSAQMKQVINTSRVDLVVLDLMLDGEDGLDVARDLRRRDTVPIIILSARGALLDRILGLEMGADDYLPKPFDPRKLLAKIRSVLRRTRAAPTGRPSDAAAYVDFAGWRLDTCMKQMLSPQGVVVPISTACCARCSTARTARCRVTTCSTKSSAANARRSTAPSTSA